MGCASINRTQATLTSPPTPLANVYSHGSNNSLSSSAKLANSARPALLRDSSRHTLGINVQAIHTLDHTYFYVFLRCAL